MKKALIIFITCLLMISLVMASAVFADDEDKWSNDYYRIMDVTDSLSEAEINRLDNSCVEFVRTYHIDLAVAALPESRLDGENAKDFAAELYHSCGFGYGDNKDGFMCLYIEDTENLVIVPIGGADGFLPDEYIDFLEERVPSLRENNGVYGVFYGCLELMKSGCDTVLGNNSATDIRTNSGDFARCGEDSGMPSWFPANLDEAYTYFDPDASRVVDYADIISPATEEAIKERIAEISAECGKDIVIVTDVSSYGLGEDIYAADFYDYNGYGFGEEHEGILLFINVDPYDRGGWTVETGSETRNLLNYYVSERLDDFLYATLATGDYDNAFSDWVEDVYDVFRFGIPRPPFWYKGENSVPDNYRNPDAPIVVDEWGLLTEEQIAELVSCAGYIKDNYGVSVYYHTTGDQLGMSEPAYNTLYMSSMGYDKDAVLFTVENTDGDTVKYSHVYLYGELKEKIPEKFLSRIENNASSASDSYGRLFEGQRLLTAYLKNGRVPRNSVYWGMIAVLSAFTGLVGGAVPLSKASESMRTISSNKTAYSYLDESKTSCQTLSKTFLYSTSSRVYIAPASTGSSSSRSSGGSSSHRSSYSGHSGTSHSGHGRKF